MVKQGERVLGVVTISPGPYNVHLLVRLAQELDGFKVVSFFSGDPQSLLETGALPDEIHPINMGGAAEFRRSFAGAVTGVLREFRAGKRMLRRLVREQVDVVIVNGYGSVSFLRVIGGCHRRSIPVFVRGDSNIRGEAEAGRIERWVKRRLLRWVMKRVEGVMPVGSLGSQFFLEYGAEPERLFVVPLEPDYEYFRDIDPTEVARVRGELALGLHRRCLLFVGRLAPEKRVDLLIDAFSSIANERQGWDLVVAGDGRLRDELGARIPEEVSSRVHWLGLCDQERLRAVYAMCDVLVLPSDREPWALVVNEAMAVGLPVVASDAVGAAYDLVEDFVSGRIFPRGDVESLRNCLLDVTDSDKADLMAGAVVQAVEEWRRLHDPVDGIRRALADIDSVASE